MVLLSILLLKLKSLERIPDMFAAEPYSGSDQAQPVIDCAASISVDSSIRASSCCRMSSRGLVMISPFSGSSPLPGKPIGHGVGAIVRDALVFAPIYCIVSVCASRDRDGGAPCLYVNRSCIHPRVADARLRIQPAQ